MPGEQASLDASPQSGTKIPGEPGAPGAGADEADDAIEGLGWIHCNVHRAVDYMLGPTRIVCNPRGHANEAASFVPGRIVQLRCCGPARG